MSMDKDTLHDAIQELRKDMRARVGKKILSIDISHHDGEEKKDDEEETPDEAKKLLHHPLLGG